MPVPFFGGKLKCIALDLSDVKDKQQVSSSMHKFGLCDTQHLLLELLEDALIWCSQHVVDLGNLVQLIGSRKERIQTETDGYDKHQQSYLHSFCLQTPHCHSPRALSYEATNDSLPQQTLPHDLKEDATGAPHVHLKAVVAISEEAFWCSVPACGYVFRVWRLGVHAPTRTEVAKLQTVLLQT